MCAVFLLALVGCARATPGADTEADDTDTPAPDDTSDGPCYRAADCVPDEPSWRAVDVQGHAACGITSAGDIRCWPPEYGERPEGSSWVDVVVGTRSRCALSADGEIRCWGVIRDVAPDPPGRFVDVVVYQQHACALYADSNLQLCWGEMPPGYDPPEGPFKAISFGCGIVADGRIWCWGDEVPEVTGGTWLGGDNVELASASRDACGIRTDGTVHCFGGPDSAETGGAGPLHGLTLGAFEGCALEADGRPVCWDSYWGYPDLRLDGRRFQRLELGDSSEGCGITLDGGMECWAPP